MRSRFSNLSASQSRMLLAPSISIKRPCPRILARGSICKKTRRLMSQEFIDAATKGDVAKVKEMLQADPSLAGSRDENGLSVVLKALYYGKRDVVELLLASGVELNLFEAAATGQTDRVRRLVQQEPANVSSYSPDGFTPLSLAVFFGHPETVDLLLAAGAEVNAASRETMKLTPLASAMAT